MNISIGKRWENFVDTAVNEGRYSSASEVMREGLRLVEERETKLKALRETLSTSIERGGRQSKEDIYHALERATKELQAEGLS